MDKIISELLDLGFSDSDIISAIVEASGAHGILKFFPDNFIWRSYPVYCVHEENLDESKKEEVMKIVEDAKVITLDHSKCYQDHGRGGGEDPPVEWIIDPDSAPDDAEEDYRYVHGHHFPGELIDLIKKVSPFGCLLSWGIP